MIDARGNLWTYPPKAPDARVITTNGTVKKNGECVMGRGCALEAARRWPRFPLYLGQQLLQCGNVVLDCGIWPSAGAPSERIVTFPVKHEWHQTADLDLIRKSAIDLVQLTGTMGWTTIVMPRPGCGNGHLDWAVVKPVLEAVLDDRFHVITF